ncbi:MAG: phosphoadenylyl-sulfate reductase [Pseudomonadales bacterium]|nr:phosphoadenylyl-sulfate reductase [Pseudomonadales bacterium]MCP5185184.1 phosphoadenylyl-sulfate reductase [Pseudomonadales bacterium]
MDHPNSQPQHRSPSPQDILADAAARFAADKVAISFSGAEDVVLVDMARQLGLDVAVFSLDTGRLHPETYRYLETVREHYGVAIELLSPDPEALQTLVREKGLYSFLRDGHGECCGVRKIMPLRRKLATLDAWITGQRRDQSVTRVDVPHEQVDKAFSTENHPVVKFNPLAGWTSADVWSYIRTNGVPYNPLHDRGFVSIGCEPCTRPVGPHEHERAGRWWWEEATQKECGLHAQNVIRIVNR